MDEAHDERDGEDRKRRARAERSAFDGLRSFDRLRMSGRDVATSLSRWQQRYASAVSTFNCRDRGARRQERSLGDPERVALRGLRLRLERVALRGLRLRLAFFVCLFAAWSSSAAAQPRLTFTKDIAPIVWTRCASCHRPGEVGPFSLLTYDDVRRRAAQIASVTSRRIMPPWKPEAGKGEFLDERRLTDRELESLQQWIASGASEGDAADLPPMPNWKDGWRLGVPDVVVHMP